MLNKLFHLQFFKCQPMFKLLSKLFLIKLNLFKLQFKLFDMCKRQLAIKVSHLQKWILFEQQSMYSRLSLKLPHLFRLWSLYQMLIWLHIVHTRW